MKVGKRQPLYFEGTEKVQFYKIILSENRVFEFVFV